MLAQSKSAPVQASKSVSIHGKFSIFKTKNLKKSQMNAINSKCLQALHTLYIHFVGYVTSITRCLTECPQLLHHDIFANLKQHYLCLIQLNIQIIQTMLGIMARGSESEGCPSFAEIGQALESLIVENEEDYSQTEALSGEHQYLLSWCWVNIKVFRVCLLVMNIVMLKHYVHQCLLSLCWVNIKVFIIFLSVYVFISKHYMHQCLLSWISSKIFLVCVCFCGKAPYW